MNFWSCNQWRRATVVISLALACGPGGDDGASSDATGASTSATADTTSPDTSSGDSTGETSVASETDETGEASTSATTLDSTGDASTTGAPPACEPLPEDVIAEFEVDGGLNYDPFEHELTKRCTVEDVLDGVSLQISLGDCKADPEDPDEQPTSHALSVAVTKRAAIDLEVGDEVWFTYYTNGPFSVNHALSLRRAPDELILAGLMGWALSGEEYGPPLEFFAPVSLELFERCPVEPKDDSGCFDDRREGVLVAVADGEPIELIDSSASAIPDSPYFIAIADAVSREVQCPDVLPRTLRFIMLKTR